MRKAWIAIALFALATGCSSRKERIIQYLVIAEVAESQALEPDMISVKSIGFSSENDATARVECAEPGSRSIARTKLTCHLIHQADRWHVEGCRVDG